MKQQINVVIDTSSFIANSYVQGNMVTQLAEYGHNKKISIYIPDIIDKEVRKHIEADVDTLYAKKRGVLKLLTEHQDVQKAKDAIIKKYEDWKIHSNAEVISSGDIDVLKIIDDYFNGRAPFHKKKEEFPDAIVLAAVAKKFTALKQTAYVFSEDVDWLDYKDPSLKLLKGLEFSKVLYEANKVYEMNLVNTLDEHVTDSSKEILEDIEKGLSEAVENDYGWGFWYGDIDVDEIHIDSIRNLNLDQQYVSNVDAKNSKATVNIILSFDYEITISGDNYENAVYDREDERYYFRETARLTKEGTAECSINIQVDYFDDDDFDYEIDFSSAVFDELPFGNEYP